MTCIPPSSDFPGWSSLYEPKASCYEIVAYCSYTRVMGVHPRCLSISWPFVMRGQRSQVSLFILGQDWPDSQCLQHFLRGKPRLLKKGNLTFGEKWRGGGWGAVGLCVLVRCMCACPFIFSSKAFPKPKEVINESLYINELSLTVCSNKLISEKMFLICTKVANKIQQMSRVSTKDMIIWSAVQKKAFLQS